MNFWNLVPGYLMWIVWMERNRIIAPSSFEDIEKSLVQLKNLFQRTLFYWSQCWGFSDYSSIIEFLFSLRMSFNFSVSLFFCCFFFVHHCEHLVFFFLYLLSIILLILPIIKKRVQGPPIYV